MESISSIQDKLNIMKRLNEERLIHQKAEEGFNGKIKIYSTDDKQKVLDDLNNRRLSTQKREEIKVSRTHNKEIYVFGGKSYYKFLNMEREYFVEIVDIDCIGNRPSLTSLYYRTFEELKKKEVLMKIEIYSDKFFISYDSVRVYFKGYSFENRR